MSKPPSSIKPSNQILRNAQPCLTCINSIKLLGIWDKSYVTALPLLSLRAPKQVETLGLTIGLHSSPSTVAVYESQYGLKVYDQATDYTGAHDCCGSSCLSHLMLSSHRLGRTCCFCPCRGIRNRYPAKRTLRLISGTDGRGFRGLINVRMGVAGLWVEG